MCIYLQMNATCRRSAFIFELPPVYELVTQLRFDRLTNWPMKNKKLIVKLLSQIQIKDFIENTILQQLNKSI